MADEEGDVVLVAHAGRTMELLGQAENRLGDLLSLQASGQRIAARMLRVGGQAPQAEADELAQSIDGNSSSATWKRTDCRSEVAGRIRPPFTWSTASSRAYSLTRAGTTPQDTKQLDLTCHGSNPRFSVLSCS